MDTLTKFTGQGKIPMWHLCTPGESSGIIFRNPDDYIYGMNVVGVSASLFRKKVSIFTFQLMSNHLHFVLEGTMDDVEEFYEDVRLRLRRYLIKQERVRDIEKTQHQLIEIKDIMYLRNVIAYVNRNGYLVDSNVTPYSYEWGANRYFFNLSHKYEEKYLLKDVGKRRKGEMFHTRDVDFPDNYYMTGGYISPACYCNIKRCESIFKNAHHYFSLISRKVESFADIAREIGDTISYTDEEMILIALNYSNQKFGKSNLILLDKNEKIELAKVMHFSYNSANKQINRILKLEMDILNSLFPQVAVKR